MLDSPKKFCPCTSSPVPSQQPALQSLCPRAKKQNQQPRTHGPPAPTAQTGQVPSVSPLLGSSLHAPASLIQSLLVDTDAAKRAH